MGGTTSTTTPLTDSYRGVTADSISIVVPIVDTTSIAELFSVELKWGDQQAKYEVVIDSRSVYAWDTTTQDFEGTGEIYDIGRTGPGRTVVNSR